MLAHTLLMAEFPSYTNQKIKPWIIRRQSYQSHWLGASAQPTSGSQAISLADRQVTLYQSSPSRVTACTLHFTSHCLGAFHTIACNSGEPGGTADWSALFCRQPYRTTVYNSCSLRADFKLLCNPIFSYQKEVLVSHGIY